MFFYLPLINTTVRCFLPPTRAQKSHCYDPLMFRICCRRVILLSPLNRRLCLVQSWENNEVWFISKQCSCLKRNDNSFSSQCSACPDAGPHFRDISAFVLLGHNKNKLDVPCVGRLVEVESNMELCIDVTRMTEWCFACSGSPFFESPLSRERKGHELQSTHETSEEKKTDKKQSYWRDNRRRNGTSNCLIMLIDKDGTQDATRRRTKGIVFFLNKQNGLMLDDQEWCWICSVLTAAGSGR